MRSGLTGRGLMQSQEEWATRNEVLTNELSRLVIAHLHVTTSRAIDVGCQAGVPTDMFAERVPLAWHGIDPVIRGESRSPKGIRLLYGTADAIPFPDQYFDCVMLANVYEHIQPSRYDASLQEMWRVLAPEGIIVGQIPNPYFPIESHSRLPFMGWLPYKVQKIYWRLSPAPWEHDFYVVTARQLHRRANANGFETVILDNFNYPLDVIPRSVRWLGKALAGPMHHFPWAWQFVFRKRARE